MVKRLLTFRPIPRTINEAVLFAAPAVRPGTSHRIPHAFRLAISTSLGHFSPTAAVGAKRAIALFLGLQALMIPFFIEARQAPSFYSWAVLFGLGFGGPMPVYAMLFREYFGTRAIGTILGVFFMVASIGMGSGGMMGGVLYNLFGDYSVPFLTSSTTGMISAILALTLPSPKREARVQAPQMALQTS